MNAEPVVKHNAATPELDTHERCLILESWNEPADREASVARARVPPGTVTRWHHLTGITERYVILEGRGTVEVGELRARRIGPGDVVYIPPGTPQRIRNDGEGDLVFHCVCTPAFRYDAYVDLE